MERAYGIVKAAECTGLEVRCKKRHIHLMSTTLKPQNSRSRIVLAGIAALALIGAGAAWYGFSRNHADVAEIGECRAAQTKTAGLEPFAKGEIAALNVNAKPKPPPAIAFTGGEGQLMSLADFRGKTILVNLWATWCVPCRQEMPALDKLQVELGGNDFQVVAINVDTRNPDKPKAWLQENGIKNLTYHADPAGKLLQVLQKSGHVVGLPTTFVVDPSGCEIAILKGPAEWASPDALAFVKAALGKS